MLQRLLRFKTERYIMTDTHFWASIITSVFLGLMATTMQTRNIASSIIFKFIPLVLAVLNALVALKVIQ